MSDTTETNWYLQVTYADHLGNEFLTLGGAGWPTKAERDAEFASIPEAPDPGPAADGTYILDVIESDGYTHSADKIISEATAHALLGQPLDDLKAKARAENRAADQLFAEHRAAVQS